VSFNILCIRLENAYSSPKKGFLGVKVGEKETIRSFIPLGMQYPGSDALQIKQHKNRFWGCGPRRVQNLGSQKRKLKTTQE